MLRQWSASTQTEGGEVTFWAGSVRMGTYRWRYRPDLGGLLQSYSKEDLYIGGRRVAPQDRLGSDIVGKLVLPYGEQVSGPVRSAAGHPDSGDGIRGCVCDVPARRGARLRGPAVVCGRGRAICFGGPVHGVGRGGEPGGVEPVWVC